MLDTESYTAEVIREFRRLKRLADQAMAQVGDEAFRTAPDPDENSIAIVVKHVAGNMHSRWRDFLTTDGEKADRRRDREFELDEGDTRARLIARWESGWALLAEALIPLGGSDLERSVLIRGEAFTVLQAINRQLTHYAYHAGQIVLLARQLAGDRWRCLSVPRGKSEEFNLKPDRYLDGEEA